MKEPEDDPPTHLLAEFRVELDWITRSLEAAVQDDIKEMLVLAHRRAQRRLTIAAHMYAIAGRHQQIAVVAAHLRHLLEAEFPRCACCAVIATEVEALAEALHRYCRDAPSDEADRRVRKAWRCVDLDFFGDDDRKEDEDGQ